MTSIRITTTAAIIAPTITPMEEESLDDDGGGSVLTSQSLESVDASIAGHLGSMPRVVRPTVMDGEDLTQSFILLLTTSAAVTIETKASTDILPLNTTVFSKFP